MDLIIKPTELCNFSCTFCSSTHIAAHKKERLSHEHIFDFLRRFPQTRTIIVNGGDPLMVEPDYYWKIIDFLNENKMPAILSFTTNLWAFYKNPEKWKPLFLVRDRVYVGTSFNYGTTRRVTPSVIFTDDLFWKCSDAMLEHIGYRPGFISVITEENESTALDNVRLAKKMGVECKLNYAMASGAQGQPYLLGKIYRLYLDVIKEGLAEWEFNAKQMTVRLHGIGTACPLLRECDSTIRCLQPGGTYYSCGAFGDDHFEDKGKYQIDFKKEVKEGKFFTPLKEHEDMSRMKDECLSCPMYSICNGCHKTIKDYKKLGLVEEHCKIMKGNAAEIQALPIIQPDVQSQLGTKHQAEV